MNGRLLLATLSTCIFCTNWSAAAETLPAPPSDPAVRTADPIKRGSKETLSGLPYITDADTITISGTRIRLAGIDAPEMGQVCLDKAGREYRCGEAAREALTKVAAGLTWTCELQERPDRYGRRVGVCFVSRDDPSPHGGGAQGGRADINRWLVRQGRSTRGTSCVGDERPTRTGSR